jgi:hypothetical protein
MSFRKTLSQLLAKPAFLKKLQMTFIFAFVMLLNRNIHAQGCSLCLDTTQSTPPSVQAAYRHAIYLLGGTGASLFIAGTLLFRRHR